MQVNPLFSSARCLMAFVALFFAGCTSPKKLQQQSRPVTSAAQQVQVWLTAGDRSSLLSLQQPALSFSPAASALPAIQVDERQVFQQIDGFGFTLTGGSATLINRLPETEKEALLQELFSRKEGSIGVNYLRLSIGASDLSAHTFTYNDLPEGQTDINQEQFSIAMEKTDLLPVLKRILSINPHLKIMGSPWSAPLWMKDRYSFKGGSLKPEYYESYARYFVKYLAAMKAEGIPLDAITIQNEPLHPGNVPSMYMSAQAQATFIKTALGPLFKREGVKTKIIVYDHNADHPEYPISILNDPQARTYIDGSAFHLYGGSIDALSRVHEAHPDKHLYFTEQWVGGPGNFAEDLKWHVANLIIGATRNWSRTVLEWNLAADANYQPHTDGGCTSCLGALTIGPGITRNVAYYIIAHASKFVPSNSRRIHSSLIPQLPNVAFITPEGNTVLIMVNEAFSEQRFSVKNNGKSVPVVLPAGAVATLLWSQGQSVTDSTLPR